MDDRWMKVGWVDGKKEGRLDYWMTKSWYLEGEWQE